LAVFLLKAFAISLSGVLAPGPMTAAAVARGARSRHAGALMAVGHAVIELPLMLLIMAGAGKALASEAVKIGIGLLGGAFLLAMGAQLLWSLRKAGAAAGAGGKRGPVLTGILLSGGNPYFLLWWATIGLALTTQAAQLGVLAFGLFAAVHWVCDLVWLELLSLASFKGARLMGGRAEKVVLAVCGAALVAFGGMFLWDAGGKLLASASPGG